MPTRTVTIYRVPNTYVSSGTDSTILGTYTMVITDDDSALDATEAADSGTSQIITVNGTSIDSYEFFYDDNIDINGGTETVKTFQLTVGSNTYSFIMNDDDDEIVGAGTGDTISLNTYANYTTFDYVDLPCFTKGTLIETQSGSKPIEALVVGDFVGTVDNGFQPIRWIGKSTLTLRDLIARPHLRPVTIPENAFGKSLPARELTVSPQHRVLLEGWEVEMNFGLDQVLVPAKSLAGRAGISVDTKSREVEYYHIMFDQHEVVFSEGLPTESFLVGDTIRDGMDKSQLDEILELFPELADDVQAQATIPARPILKNYEASVLSALAA